MKRLPVALVTIFVFLFPFLFFAPKTNNVLATTKTLTASADAMLKSASENSNYGGIIWLAISRLRTPLPGQKHRSLVQFNTSRIPSNASVTSATLSIYFTDCGSTYSQDVDNLNIGRNQQAWVENEVTWSNKPSFDTSSVLNYTAPCTPANRYLTHNVINFVSGWVENTYANYGITLYGDEGAGESWIKNFYSKEHGANKPPKLTVNYTVPSGTANGNGTTSDETSDTDEEGSKTGKDKVATDSATISAQKATPSTTLADKAKGISGWKIALLAVLIILLAGTIAGYIIYRRKKKLASKKELGKTDEKKEETNPQSPLEK